MRQKQEMLTIPKDGWEGLKENFFKDATSGFVVFLLALPLSLGIAGASGFPPVMGVISAIIGGLLATFLTGSQLAIKGPAAGLIVIVAEAVSEFGGGGEGWKLALGVMFVAGICQILFGVFKWGKFVDIFPLSAVHGMLAAIGLIIIAKQIPVLLNVDPALTTGKGPFALFGAIPQFFANLDPRVSIIGGVSLAIMIGWGFVKNPILKKIPAPLLVLLFAIPMSLYLNLGTNAPAYTLVKVGKITDQLGVNVSLHGVSHLAVFIKFVLMVALVGSLESLLTVKAIDMLDPWKRKSRPNKDLIAVGVCNTLAAVVGGPPMISEVARSSANVAQGGRTRWANFFHGGFLLVSVLFAYPLLEQIPKAALAAMLIAVGVKLAHPKEFVQTYKTGVEQLAIFLTTIFFTLFEDLLVGIGAGMLLKALIHVFRGAPLKSLFKSGAVVTESGGDVTVNLGEAAVFTNYLGIKTILDRIPGGKNVRIEINETKLVDHSVMENLHLFEQDYHRTGGRVELVGLEHFTSASDHPMAARHKKGQSFKNKRNDKIPPLDESEAPFDESHLIHELKHYLPSQAALKDFVHHNPLHAFQDGEFFQSIFTASKIFGIKTTLSFGDYRKLHRQGRIKDDIIERVIVQHKGVEHFSAYREKMVNGEYHHQYEPAVGQLRAEWKKQYKFDLDNLVQPTLFRIIASYLDQGIAIKHFPFEDTGLINAIRTLESNSFVSFFKSGRVKNLIFSDDLSTEKLLKIVVGRRDYFEQYVIDQQFGHKGWSGIINAIEDNPKTLLYPKKIDLRDFIMLELLLEIDALDTEFGVTWEPLTKRIECPPQSYFTKSFEMGETEEVLQLWQEAFEWTYYDEVLSGVGYLAKRSRAPEKSEISFQAIFCVDDRECSIRRHVEQIDPDSVTFGAPGFFGAGFYFQSYGGKFYEKNCPVALTPTHLIKEIESNSKRGREVFHHKNSHTFFRGFMFSLAMGGFASFRMLLDLFRPRMRFDIADAFGHMDMNGKLLIECGDPDYRENGLQVGYTVPEMVVVVETLLTGIGLTGRFADVVYVVAHGSSSANNPHHGAHDCGACSGRPGAPNARVFAFMANHPEVRSALAGRGLIIPDSSKFLAAMHDTASDEIGYYDLDTLPSETLQRHRENLKVIEDALDQNAKERARRFASINIKQNIKKIRKAIKERSVSYFEPRPELGHGSNALCYVGGRERLKGLFLDRRAFLQSYDYRTDPDGTILSKVLSPLPLVCGGINLEYYFSRMDNERMGSGTKLPHNVNGLIGVTNGSDGDLRPGLPWQMVENHDPVRLLLLVEHRPEVVLEVIKSSKAIYDWFDLGWLHLVAVSPDDGSLYHFRKGEFILYDPIAEVKEAESILDVIAQTPEMKTSHLSDSTKENIPVQVYRK